MRRSPTCPSCKDPADPMVRVKRTWRERMLWFLTRRYQCFRCGRAYVRVTGAMIQRNSRPHP